MKTQGQAPEKRLQFQLSPLPTEPIGKSFFLSGPQHTCQSVCGLDNTSPRILPLLRVLQMSIVNSRLVRLSRQLPVEWSQRRGTIFSNPPWPEKLVAHFSASFQSICKSAAGRHGCQAPPRVLVYNLLRAAVPWWPSG